MGRARVCVPTYRSGVGQLGVGEVAEYVNGQLGRHMAQGVTQRAPLVCIICPHHAKPNSIQIIFTQK